MKITLISDTHCKHKELDSDLHGGSLLIHSGDISNRGSISDVKKLIDNKSTSKGEFVVII